MWQRDGLIALVFFAALVVDPRAALAEGEPEAPFVGAIDQRLAAQEKTEGLLEDMISERREQLARRVRGFYKLSRAGWSRPLVDEREREHAARRRAAARRILRREVSELALIRGEMAAARGAGERLARERATRAGAAPAPGSLHPPVAFARVERGFGEYRDRVSGARLVSRGLELSARAGRNVRALEAGVVRWTGELRGLGQVVVVDHRGEEHDFVAVLARLDPAEVAVAAGEAVERGQVLGEAAGELVYVEIRLPLGAEGFPVDPEPLFALP